jgi:hypothetical protein
MTMALLLASCGGGQRWLAANSESIEVHGATYKVDWLPGAATREFQLKVAPPLIFFPDAYVEEKESAEAGEVVARKLCNGPATKTISHRAPSGIIFEMEYRCA